MNIKTGEHAKNWAIRDRAVRYWQNEVVTNHLPPIDKAKREEMDMLKKQATQCSTRLHTGLSGFQSSARNSIRRQAKADAEVSAILQNTLHKQSSRRKSLIAKELAFRNAPKSPENNQRNDVTNINLTSIKQGSIT